MMSRGSSPPRSPAIAQAARMCCAMVSRVTSSPKGASRSRRDGFSVVSSSMSVMVSPVGVVWFGRGAGSAADPLPHWCVHVVAPTVGAPPSRSRTRSRRRAAARWTRPMATMWSNRSASGRVSAASVMAAPAVRKLRR